MRNLLVKLSFMAILVANLVACNKTSNEVIPTATPDVSNKFVGHYMGSYVEKTNIEALRMDDMQAVVTKKTATDLRFNLSVKAINFTLNGTVLNDTVVKVTDTKCLDYEIMKGTITLRGKDNLYIEMTTHEPNSPEMIQVIYNGKR
jgi:hypothetical protein